MLLGTSETNLRQGFATTRPVGSDLSKLTLIGRLTKDPETRLTKNEKEYCVYVYPSQCVGLNISLHAFLRAFAGIDIPLLLPIRAARPMLKEV